MKPRKHFIEYLVSLGHNMAETGPTKNPEKICGERSIRRQERREEREKYLDRVERVADYDLGDAGGGSGDVLLGRVARSGHLKNWRRAQVLECLRRGKCRTGEKGKGWPGPSGTPAPSYGSECGEEKGRNEEAPA
jgi:hypothetical protein